MRTPARLLFALFVAASALCSSVARAPLPAASAQEKDPGFGFYEDRARKILKSAGDKVWETAKTAKGWGLHQMAFEQAERTIEFDPDHKDAREHLGYVRKADKWVLDPDAASKVPKQNQKSEKESDESLQKKIDKWKDESLAKADVFVAAKYAELGDECAAKGYPEQAVKGWEASLRLDKDNAKARKGLGYKRLGKVWLTDKQDKARQDAAKPEVVTEETQWDDFFGSKLNKVQSTHFRFEGHFPVEELKGYIQAAETTYCYYLADFEMDPTQDVFGGRRMETLLLKDEAQWNKYIDAFGGDDKEFTRKMSGTGGGLNRVVAAKDAKSSVTSRTDMIVHNICHTLNERVWKIRGNAWLDEGLAYYYTIKVLENTLTHCVAQKKTGAYGNQNDGKVEGGVKRWDEAANWKPKVKEMVQKKNDVPLRTLVFTPITTLEFEATVKSWCVITWLMDKDRSKFMDVLRQLGAGSKPDDALQETYEQGIEELDAAWQKFALKTY